VGGTEKWGTPLPDNPRPLRKKHKNGSQKDKRGETVGVLKVRSWSWGRSQGGGKGDKEKRF